MGMVQQLKMPINTELEPSTVFDCTVIQLPRIQTLAGSITVVNNCQEISFSIQRVYYLYDIPTGEARGGHAHKKLDQLIIAASGSFDVRVDDARIRHTVTLSRPNVGLYIPSGLWRELDDFSGGSICLVLASTLYNESDYIRDYSVFSELKRHK